MLPRLASISTLGIAVQETTLIPGADRFFIHDPDGNRIEIVQWLRPYSSEENARDSQLSFVIGHSSLAGNSRGFLCERWEWYSWLGAVLAVASSGQADSKDGPRRWTKTVKKSSEIVYKIVYLADKNPTRQYAEFAIIGDGGTDVDIEVYDARASSSPKTTNSPTSPWSAGADHDAGIHDQGEEPRLGRQRLHDGA